MKAYKVEININDEQKRKIEEMMRGCRFIYNFYLDSFKKIFDENHRYLKTQLFYKWFTENVVVDRPSYIWICKANKMSLMNMLKNAEKGAYEYYKGQRETMPFKKKMFNNIKLHYNKNIICERHRIQIDDIGWIQLKEKGYIPTNVKIEKVIISREIDKYFVSAITKENIIDKKLKFKEKNVEKDLSKLNKMEKKLRREEKKLERKYQALEERIQEGDMSLSRRNINKQIIKIQKVKKKLSNI